MTTPLSSQTDVQLSSPVTILRGVGKQRAAALNQLGIKTIGDLLRHLPMRYEYESAQTTIDQLLADSIGQVSGQVMGTQIKGKTGGRRSQSRFEAILEDDTGRLLLTWFNGSYLQRQIRPSQQLRVQGKVQLYGGYKQIVNPRWEIIDEQKDDLAADRTAGEDRFRPVYPATEKLSSRDIEGYVDQILEPALKQLHDPLDDDFLKKLAMPSLADAFAMAHRPDSQDAAKTARRRLAYNEFLLLQLGIALKRRYVRHNQTAWALHYSKAVDSHICSRFPFELTQSQAKVIQEISSDLATAQPMNRLLQGDVGSGKTVIGLYALLMAAADHQQGALMAPTQLLADQHFSSISRMLEGSNVRIALLTGQQSGTTQSERDQLLKQIAGGEIDIVVGTHALLSEQVQFHHLAVVIIDEQHRFGVMQRAKFKTAAPQNQNGKKSDGATAPALPRVPHHLVMTATPIPRTLSLTIFGDLDVSTIAGLPPGRTPVINRLVTPDKADTVYEYMQQRLQRGEQAYVVVPMIEDSDQVTTQDLKNVQEHTAYLKDKFGKKITIAAMHGRLSREEREKIMVDFRTGAIDVLVATTVIEVGVDVPNATMMVIEHAERFGLAQLHQLRGRVGRGSKKALCVFIGAPKTEEGQKRLKAIGSTNDGFKIAEMDLEIRGMGDFFGTRQSGLPPLRVARIPEDMQLLQQARRDASEIIETDPTLSNPKHQLLRKVLMKEYGQALGIIDVG